MDNRRRVRDESKRLTDDCTPVNIDGECECFRIESHKLDAFDFDIDNEDLKLVPVDNCERMKEVDLIDVSNVDTLWMQKDRMDVVFDTGNGNLYQKVRDNFFPQDQRGSSHFLNRAGDKLKQIDDAVGGSLFNIKFDNWVFFDICGGPGAFSQLLLKKAPSQMGYGMTLRDSTCKWYSTLEENPNFKILWGEDNQGDVYVPENLTHALNIVKSDKAAVAIVVSDGGFKIRTINGVHKENQQELFSGRIILSEFAFMTMLLMEGGNFVIKLFDTFSYFTVSLIYLSTLIFDKVYIVKPTRSRIVNSERYLIGISLHSKQSPLFISTQKILMDLHKKIYLYTKENPGDDVNPHSCVPLSFMKNDQIFLPTIRSMNNFLCEKQVSALQMIMDEVERKLKIKGTENFTKKAVQKS